MQFQVNQQGLESTVTLKLRDSWIEVIWDIRSLGGPFPGENWMVKDAELSFTAEGKEPVILPLIAPKPHRATICGLTAFRRMRGMEMPSYPLSYAFELPEGDYEVSFSAELIDCRRLVHYCDAVQFFVVDFEALLQDFDALTRKMYDQKHGEALEPYRFDCRQEHGTFHVPAGHNAKPYYWLSCVYDTPSVPWLEARQLVTPIPEAGPLAPQHYFEKQVKSGIPFMREYNFCRYGTHCTEAPVPAGNYGTGLRPFVMWGHSFTMHWALTGDAESGAAASYATRMSLAYAERAPRPYGQHVLTFGMGTMEMIRYAKATGDNSILELIADIWRRWPYDPERHNLATQPDERGGDMTANDTYNMKMVGATACWLLGRHLGDEFLMDRGRDSVLKFVLPGFLPKGYWFYRPGSPEGQVVDGVMAQNHYDGFVKAMLGRLLAHPEWRAEPGALDVLRRGMDFVLKNLTAEHDGGRSLTWELYRGLEFGTNEAHSRHIGHAGMNAEPMLVLARYVDSCYLGPLEKSMQYAYDLRDSDDLKDYWDNSWLYGFYAGVFSLAQSGVEFQGEPKRLRLALGADGTPCI